VRAEAHEAFDAPKIININQSLIPHLAHKAVCAISESDIMGRLIVASQYLAFRKPGGDWHPETQLSSRQEERA
jgi:hypothetical protein